MLRSISRRRLVAAGVAAIAMVAAAPAAAQAPASPAPTSAPRLTLQRLVTPAGRVEVQGRVIRFALLGQIYFDTLDDLFRYIDIEAGRWRFETPEARQAFADGLLRRGVESRVVSMETELPLELLLTHTRDEVAAAVSRVASGSAVFQGRHWQLTPAVYRDAFLRVRDRWTQSLNCWSASSSIPGRVLSNWYVIDEGITLFGAGYDSTEHFWQAVKFHPDVTVGQLRELLATLRRVDWKPWLDTLAADQAFYFANAYAVEFLTRTLTAEALDRFDAELGRLDAATPARAAQQRGGRAPGAPLAFTALQEKVLWGDLADVFHLVVVFAGEARPAPPAAIAAARTALIGARFDAIYLDGYAGGRVGFLSPEFQALMLEIWKVKFLQLPRLTAVIRSTAGVHLDHYLNDGDSPDIPIPIYVGYLNRIREMALELRP
jgi:hypothetical protein